MGQSLAQRKCVQLTWIPSEYCTKPSGDCGDHRAISPAPDQQHVQCQAVHLGKVGSGVLVVFLVNLFGNSGLPSMEKFDLHQAGVWLREKESRQLCEQIVASVTLSGEERF